jgi:hypothetical protein
MTRIKVGTHVEGGAVICLNHHLEAVKGCPSSDLNDPGNLQFDWLDEQLKTFRSRQMQVSMPVMPRRKLLKLPCLTTGVGYRYEIVMVRFMLDPIFSWNQDIYQRQTNTIFQNV